MTLNDPARCIDSDTNTTFDTSGLDLATMANISAASSMGASGTTASLYSYNTIAWPPANVTITTNNTGAGGNGSYLYSNGTTPLWTTTLGATNPGCLQVKGDAEFEGDIKWHGRNLGKLLEKIEDRLAILPEPDPAKLEKHAALKKAYDHYKLMEKLIGED